MKTLLLWVMMLTKRLYKKVTFSVIVLLIPLVAFGYSMINTDDSGIVTIGLAAEQPSDEYACEVIAEIGQEGQLIHYVTYATAEEADAAVRNGKCDAAWIFTEDLHDAVKQYAADPDEKVVLARVLEREDNVALMLAREKLEGKLYDRYAPYIYLKRVRDVYPQTADWSDEEILHYYETTEMDNEALFEFAQSDIGGIKTDVVQSHYLLTPIRGLLAVLILLCGLSAAMYYITDAKRGTFSWIPERRLSLVEFGCQAVSVVQVTLVSWVSLVMIGTAVSWWRELLIALMYVLSVAAFCMLIRRLCGSLRMMGTLLPLLTVMALVVCPVFFDIDMLYSVQYLFPPSYYINAAYNDQWLLMMPLFVCGCAAVYWLCGKVLKRP